MYALISLVRSTFKNRVDRTTQGCVKGGECVLQCLCIISSIIVQIQPLTPPRPHFSQLPTMPECNGAAIKQF